MLQRTEFLRAIQRERRRSQRSQQPLALAVFACADEHSLDGLLGELASVMRETDMLATIDDEGAAVLLPDTGEAGLDRFLSKVAEASQGCLIAIARAAYPDPAFDAVVAERLGTPLSRHTAEPSATVRAREGYSLKRCVDIIGALIALSLLWPLMLLAVLAIRATSKGPALYKQTRIGQGGTPFTMYKFRSMRVDTDDRVHREFVAGLINGAQQDGAETGAYKLKADPRVTLIGRLIRKTSIDELPQFFNVLKGNMSLVGPRPPVPYEAAQYKTWHQRRVFELKPGLTGIWQVEGRSKVPFDDMVRMDLRYLRKCSLWFDLLILLRTVKVVVTCEGAS